MANEYELWIEDIDRLIADGERIRAELQELKGIGAEARAEIERVKFSINGRKEAV